MCFNDSTRPSFTRKTRGQPPGSGAFSLIEIMIVVVIIGVLVGAVSLSSRHFLDKAKQTRARSDLATYKSAVESFYAEFGRYPTNEEGLPALSPKYIDKIRADPWGRAYQYNFPGQSTAYEIICVGADGRTAGTGVDADLTADDLDATSTPLPQEKRK